MARASIALNLLIFLHLFFSAASGPLPPHHLKCERSLVGLRQEQLKEVHRQATIAIDTPNPLLSWTVQHTDRTATQRAFQVWLWEHPNINSPLWDTGKLFSDEDSAVRYSGPQLKSGHSYYWKVRWWDGKGDMAESEEVGHFMTGILDPSDWTQAKWLAAPSNVTNSPIFTKNFTIQPQKVTSAVLYISGLGFVKPYVNNVDLNARMDPPIALSPGWTEYEMRVAYVVYNITDLAMSASSQLMLEALVGVGWRNTTDYPLSDKLDLPKSDDIPRVLRAILTITTSDGKTTSYYSDSTWSCKNSNILYVTIWDGEIIDTTQGSKTAYTAQETGGPNGKMYTASMPYIAECGSEKPVKIYPRKDSSGNMISQIVDFGNNSAGVCKINVKGMSGTISLRHAEVLQHMPFGPMDGSLFYQNLKRAKATDNFTSNGEMSTYQPSLTYHGFRYAEVIGYSRTLTDTDIEKVLIHSNVQPNSNFSSSSQLANEIQSNVVRGMLSNLMSVATDCDQRSERRGWMGDAGLSAETFLLNFHMEDFFKNYLDLIVDDMISDTIPDIVPHYGGGRPGDPSWSAAFPEIIYQMTKHGEPDIAGMYYDNMMKYINKMISLIDPKLGIGHYFSRYGDWDPAPEYKKVNNSFTSAFSLLRNIQEAIELAEKLGHQDDANRLKDTLSKQSDAFNKAFMNGTAQYLNGAQVTYVFPLALGIVPEDIKDDLIKNFINQVSGPDKAHITCGIVGVRNIFHVLSDVKQHDLAVKIVEQMDYPSYGYMIHNKNEPATTIWENWACDRNLQSRNHHMYSSVSGWIQTEMSGLVLPKSSFNFREVHFHPARALGLSYADISLEYPRPVRFSWRRNGGIQCAKVAEDQSSVSPDLPKHAGLFLSCGDEDGGTIKEVLFASFGNPTGHCGYHELGSCHASDSMDVTKKLCLGKRSCLIPTDADFWRDPCPDMIKWMAVSVQCRSPGALDLEYKFSSIVVDINVPVGTKGILHLPAHGKKNIKVEEGTGMMYTEESNKLAPVEGIELMKRELSTDTIVLKLESGSYSFKISGETPERKCIDSLQHNSTAITLSCDDPRSTIATIDWASFGTPTTKAEGDCFSRTLGDCHYGSSSFAIGNECIGLHQCSVRVEGNYFGKSHCHGDRLIIEYTCKEL